MIIEFGIFRFPDGWTFDGPEEVLSKTGQGLPWEERARTQVDVTPEMTLNEVAAIGLRKLDITIPAIYHRLPHDYSVVNDFYFEAADGSHVWIDTYVDEAGREWSRADLDFVSDRITIADVVRTVDADRLPVNPRRMLVPINVEGLGGGPIDYLLAALEFWNQVKDHPAVLTAKDAVAIGATIKTGAVAFKKIKNRFDNSHGSISKYIQLTSSPRTTPQIARLLGISLTHVPGICRLFGLKQDKGGVWRIDEAAVGKELREYAQIADLVARVGLRPNEQTLVLSRLLEYPVGSRLEHAEALIQKVEFDRRSEED